MLSSGKAVICYNPTNKLRDIMRISVSEDGGETWPHYKVIIISPVYSKPSSNLLFCGYEVIMV